MLPYRLAAKNDLTSAVSLYEWNGAVSAAWWSVIGDVEVVVRNAMHNHLSDWSSAVHREPRWYLDPGGVMSEQGRRAVATARRQISLDGKQESPGRVVAELSFGFWRFLLAARYERSLWLPVLRDAFPQLIGQGMRNDVHDALKGLQGLRNRIAHHEPIHNRPLGELHGKALAAAGWVCPDTAAWIGLRSRVPGLLECRP